MENKTNQKSRLNTEQKLQIAKLMAREVPLISERLDRKLGATMDQFKQIQIIAKYHGHGAPAQIISEDVFHMQQIIVDEYTNSLPTVNPKAEVFGFLIDKELHQRLSAVFELFSEVLQPQRIIGRFLSILEERHGSQLGEFGHLIKNPAQQE